MAISEDFSKFATNMRTNRLFLLLLSIVICVSFSSCNEEETYGEKKKRERNTISNFIKSGTCVLEEVTGDTLLYVAPIKVISEDVFSAQDSLTNLAENEYVLLAKTGIYMQIMRKGCGEKLMNGETATLHIRFI